MTARQSEKIFLDADPSKKSTAPPSHPPSSVSAESPVTTVRPGEQGTSEKRVLSVSPAREERGPEQNSKNSREVFLSPRVIDEQAFNELATTIRTLIDDATSTSERLAGLLERLWALVIAAFGAAAGWLLIGDARVQIGRGDVTQDLELPLWLFTGFAGLAAAALALTGLWLAWRGKHRESGR